MSSFERYDPNYQRNFAYHLVRGLAGVASRALCRATLDLCDSVGEKTILSGVAEEKAEPSETCDVDMQPVVPQTGIDRVREMGSIMGRTESGQWALDNIEGLLQLDFEPQLWHDIFE